MTPTVACDAVVVGDEVQFPVDTEITLVETGAQTDVVNVEWAEVSWSVAEGSAELAPLEAEPAGTVVTLTGAPGEQVSMDLTNDTASRGLIILPLRIPLPGFGCNCGGTPTGSIGGPVGGSAGSAPLTPAAPEVVPGQPAVPGQPGHAGQATVPSQTTQVAGGGHNGAPGVPAPANPGAPEVQATTGTDLRWLGAAAVALLAGGAWLVFRSRRLSNDA